MKKVFRSQTPGDVKTIEDADGVNDQDPAVDDASAARIAELEGHNAQLSAALALANSQLQDLQTVPSRVQAVLQPRVIGQDWSSMTSTEAAARGARGTVLCSDGYYVGPA